MSDPEFEAQQNTAAALDQHLTAAIAEFSPLAKAPTMSVSGAGNAAMSIKQMMEDNKKLIQKAHEKFAANAAKLAQAATAYDGLGDDVGSEADDLLATIGQFKNDLGTKEP